MECNRDTDESDNERTIAIDEQSGKLVYMECNSDTDGSDDERSITIDEQSEK